jgi:CysZ protein
MKTQPEGRDGRAIRRFCKPQSKEEERISYQDSRAFPISLFSAAPQGQRYQRPSMSGIPCDAAKAGCREKDRLGKGGKPSHGGSMISAIRKALTQFLTDPRLWLIVAACAVVSLLCFAGLWWGVNEGLSWLGETWPRYAGWLKWGQGTVSFLVVLLLALLLFPATFILVASFFQEKVADLVESRYYPELPSANGAPMKTAVLAALRFFLLMLTVNVIALPFYLALLWVAGSGAILMLLVNGLLAGREYYEIVALRRMSRIDMDASRRQNRGAYFLTGICIAAMALVPVINLLAPVLGIAIMVHIYHGRRD